MERLALDDTGKIRCQATKISSAHIWRHLKTRMHNDLLIKDSDKLPPDVWVC